MKKLYTVTLMVLMFSALGFSQSNLIIFSDGGEKFIASVNGKAFNEEPQSRVECIGLMGEGQRIDIDFEDEGIESIKKNFMTEAGMQYTVTIKKNKKGAHVLRPMDMGIPVAQVEKSPEPDPSKFQETEVVQTTSTPRQTDAVGTTVKVTETSTTTTDGDKIDVGISMGGVDMNMNVNVDDSFGGQTTTTTTTTTTTSSSHTESNVQVLESAEVADDGYVLPGYTGPVGCPYPMSDSEYADAKSSIASKSFADSKMTLAKQIGNSKCFLTDQVAGIMQEFDFEDDKLEFAKYAYDRTYDVGNYYKVNDAFTFETSIEELNEFIEGR